MTATFTPCPNSPPCAHGAVMHDAHEPGDPYPACCVPPCRCGHPGTATVYRRDDGTREVADADPVIRVSAELLADPDWTGSFVEDGGAVLDSAGEYRYRRLRTDPTTGDLIYGRVS